MKKIGITVEVEVEAKIDKKKLHFIQSPLNKKLSEQKQVTQEAICKKKHLHKKAINIIKHIFFFFGGGVI